MISFDEIAAIWQRLNIRVYTMPYTNEQYPGLGDETLALLNQYGFPEEAAPQLDFTDLLAGKLYTHSQLYTKADFPLLDDYLVIGATGEGNPICIDIKDQAVIVVDHDNGFERVFVNSSLLLFSYALAVSQELFMGKTANVEAVRQLIKDQDPSCLDDGSFWDETLSHAA